MPNILTTTSLPALLSLAASLAAAQPTLVVPPGSSQPANGADGSTSPSPQPLTVEVLPEAAPPEPVRDHAPEALAVLERAERAIAELQSFRATLTMTPTRMLEVNHKGSVEVIGRRSPEDPDRWQARITGAVTPARKPDPIDIDAVFNGSRVRFVDHEHEIVGARVLPVRLDWDHFNVPVTLWEQELWTRPEPFAEVRGAERLTLESRQTVDGVECDVVRGVLAGGQISHTIAIGVDDHLPRRAVERVEFALTPGGPPMTGEYTFEYTDLEAGLELTDGDFELPVPAGYQDQQFPQPAPPGRTQPGAGVDDSGDAAAPDSDSAAAEGFESGEEAAAAMNEHAAATSAHTVPLPARTRPRGDTSGGREAAGGDELAPAFELKDTAGQSVTLDGLRGAPAVLVFWGSWNPWARDLLEALEPVMQEAGEARFLVLAVRERSAAASAQRFQGLGVPATLLPGADEVAARYAIGAIPSIVVIDAQGRIQLRHAGFNQEASPVEAVRRALGLAEP